MPAGGPDATEAVGGLGGPHPSWALLAREKPPWEVAPAGETPGSSVWGGTDASGAQAEAAQLHSQARPGAEGTLSIWTPATAGVLSGRGRRTTAGPQPYSWGWLLLPLSPVSLQTPGKTADTVIVPAAFAV